MGWIRELSMAVYIGDSTFSFLNVNLAFYQTKKILQVSSIGDRRSNSSPTLKHPGALGTIRLTVPLGIAASSRLVG